MLYITIIIVTKHDKRYNGYYRLVIYVIVTVTVTISYNIEKGIKGFKINDIVVHRL